MQACILYMSGQNSVTPDAISLVVIVHNSQKVGLYLGSTDLHNDYAS